MKILVVSHYYTPFTGVGAKKVSSLVNFLSEKGDNLFVLRASNHQYNLQVLEEEISPNIEIFNVKDIKSTKSQFLDYILWRENYKNKIRKIVENEVIELIIFSGGPFFYFSLGEYFLKNHNVKYILDFRDPWIIGSSFHYKKNHNIIYAIKWFIISILYKYKEKRSVIHADLVLVPSKEFFTIMRKNYKTIISNKIHVIMNGFDDSKLDDIPKTTTKRTLDVMTLGIFGSFSYYSTSYIKNFLLSIKELINEGFLIEILHLGKQEQYMQDVMREFGLSNIYHAYGNIEYNKGMKLLSNVNVLLINDNSIIGHGTKIFDYIYLNKPIVAFVPKQSAIASLLSNFENGYICNSKNEISRILRNIISNNINYLDFNLDRTEYSRSFQFQILFNQIHNQLQTHLMINSITK
ncbi:MAG TPA: hypothetical protein VIN72_03385 [Lutibacter sp.]